MSPPRSDKPTDVEGIEDLRQAFAAPRPPLPRTLRQRLQLLSPLDLEMVAEKAHVTLGDEDQCQACGEDEQQEIRHLKPEELALADRKGKAYAAERGVLADIGQAAHDEMEIADDGDGEICRIEDQCPTDNGEHIRRNRGEIGGIHRKTAVQKNEDGCAH